MPHLQSYLNNKHYSEYYTQEYPREHLGLRLQNRNLEIQFVVVEMF